MKDNTVEDFFIDLVASVVYYVYSIGLVWLFAALCNPDVSSNTVWFIGFVAGMLYGGIRYHGVVRDNDRRSRRDPRG